MSDEQATSKQPRRAVRRVGFWRWVWRITAGTFAVLVVVLALFIGLFRVAVPLLPDFQERIESAATRAIGYPLSVGTIDARWRLRGPELVFENVTLRTSDEQRDWFTANRLRVSIDALELVRSGTIKPSSFTLTGSEVSLRRSTDGAWFVQGLPLETLKVERSGTLPWGTADGDFGVDNVALNIVDEMRDTQLTIPDLDVSVMVRGTQLGVSGELELIQRGPRIEFSLDADGRADDLEQVVWSGFASGKRIAWPELEKALPVTPGWTTEETVDLSLWLRAVGPLPREASLTIDARNVAVTGSERQVGRVAGQFTWAGTRESWQLNGENVELSSAAEATPGTLRLGVRPRGAAKLAVSGASSQVLSSGSSAGLSPGSSQGSSPDSSEGLSPGSSEGLSPDSSEGLSPDSSTATGNDKEAMVESDGEATPELLQDLQYTFSASELFLEDLAVLAIPASEEIASAIRDYAPSGQVRDLDGFVVKNANTVSDFAVTATLSNIGIQAGEDRPGFKGLDAKLFGSRASGGLTLNGIREVLLPGVLRRAITPTAFNASVSWEQQPGDQLLLRVNELELNTDEVQVGGEVILERSHPDVGWVADIDLAVEQLQLDEAYHYFPVNRFSGKLLNWLDNALLSGVGTNGRFELRGPLKKFPFANPQDGEFLASIRLENATLHYANNWPDATEVTADLTFDRNSLRGNVESARLLSLPIENAQATIDDLKKSIVFIEGSLSGQLDDMRAFLDATPIVQNWGDGWADAQFYGDGQAQLSLTIPTKRREDTAFDVALQFSQSRFQFRDWPQTLDELSGELNATRAGLSGSGVQGVFLGEPVTLAVTPSSIEGYTSDLTLKGVARPSSLARHLHESLADHLSGSTDWTALIRLPKVGSGNFLQARLRTPLQGMAVTLPQPLSKTAAETRFTDALLTVIDERELSVVADYGENTAFIARVRRDTDGFWFVPTGELRLGGSNALLPDSEEVRVMGSAEAVDMSEIVEFTSAYSPQRPWLELDRAEVLVSELDGLGQSFGATRVNLVRNDDGLALEFVGDKLSGSMEVPSNITPEQPVVGQFDVLKWTSTGDDSDIDPRRVPSLRSLVDNFSYNDVDLGTLVVHIEAREQLVAVREFTTTAPDFNTRTTGSWVFGGEDPTTFLLTEFQSTNVQSTLKALNQAEFLEAGQATGRLEMSWPTGWTPDYVRTMEGELSIEIGQGKLVSVDPGAGRVFGLLSIGALPRRLNLDFRDVFDSGFGFDSITGDFVIKDGNAVTDNLALTGPAANVVIVGRTGLIDKDYDQTAVVYANFGSSLPLAGAIAGGPAVGAALLVVTEIFKRPLQNMGKVSYSITGSWDEPMVARTGSARPAQPDPEAASNAEAAESDQAPVVSESSSEPDPLSRQDVGAPRPAEESAQEPTPDP